VLCILFEFPVGRYHATPWGHHVNEGLVEWPPSPWRIVRALLAVGYTKLGWKEVPREMQALVGTLSESLPTYRLPAATLGHTRHYMPIKGWKRGVQKTSLVIDAFVRPHGALGVLWPAVTSPDDRDLLGRLADRLGYLGRAESRVRARVVSPEELVGGWDVSTQRQAPDDEPVRLLAPVPSTEYATWRSEVSGAPENLLAALQIETTTLQKEGWSGPPGSREVVYWRPADAVSPRTPGPAVTAGGAMSAADTALFALATDRKRDVLPLMERALPTMGLFRRALLSKLGEEPCPELSGKDEQGLRLQDEHRHAHFLPLSLDGRNRGRVDHVLLHAPMGFGRTAQHALRRLRKTWAKGIDDIAVTLVGMGDLASFRTVAGVPLPELGRSATWVSLTPFIPPRFLKPRGKHSLDGQVRAELRHRHLPDLVVAPVVTLPSEGSEAGLQARWFRHFIRSRQNSRAPGPPPGLFRLTLTFERPVEGPLCLGWGCHFGLGLFVQTGEVMTGPNSS
jgi:CRISPR-associated protein Csb2